MLGQRRRRWTITRTALDRRLAFPGMVLDPWYYTRELSERALPFIFIQPVWSHYQTGTQLSGRIVDFDLTATSTPTVNVRERLIIRVHKALCVTVLFIYPTSGTHIANISCLVLAFKTWKHLTLQRGNTHYALWRWCSGNKSRMINFIKSASLQNEIKIHWRSY